MREFLKRAVLPGYLALSLLAAGCTPSASDGRNAFLSLAQLLGRTTDTGGTPGGGGGIISGPFFRESMSISFQNTLADLEVNFSFVAWVNTSSIRSADQQDALLSNGYVQLTRSVTLGTAYTLPPGTFVFNGPGTAGATLLRIPGGACREMSSQGPRECGSSGLVELITPDAILVFNDPPVSCDSVAYEFTQDGLPLPDVPLDVFLFEGATGLGASKTLAQVQSYQCDPFQPGLFLRGSQPASENLYLEGDSIVFTFGIVPDPATGITAQVVIGP